MKLFTTALLATCLSGAVQAASYGPYPAETYSTCGSPTATVAVELVHGGGDYRGDNTLAPNPTICAYLAAHGVYVLSVNYRLATAFGQGWPAQWQDAQLGVRWLRYHGFKRVGVVGWSAGGYNVLGATFEYGTIFSPPTDPKNEAGLYPRLSSVPDFTVDISGFTNLADNGLPPAIEPDLTRGMPAANSRAVRDATASVLTYVRPNIPPLLIIHGSNDNIVPVRQTQELMTALQAAGGSAKLILTTGKHVFIGLTPAQQDMVLRNVAACALGVTLCRG